MSDLTIPEEAIEAVENVWPRVWLSDTNWRAKVEGLLEAAAPLIVAAAMTQLADKLSDVPVELADLMGAGKQYNAGKAYVIGEMRRSEKTERTEP